ncbi:MAG: hypothetical protein M3082_00480 [Candidatus Dormibacteraeota bacterium]|nr:hypothetical protein [Candidatus Dormibacteraeota bacterium]
MAQLDPGLRYGLLGWALTQLALRGVRTSAVAVVDGWQRRMLAEAGASSSEKLA